jgi:hypothetical protein
MKMFVWEKVLCDYTCGLVCVFAENVEQAVELLKEKYPSETPFIDMSQLQVITEPEAFLVYGGG